MEHYRRNLEAAATRIGLESGREFGTRKHGFRHAYAQRLAACGLSRVLIQRCMHHHSMQSQEVYTEPEKREITTELNAAEALMKAGASPTANQIIEVQTQNLRLLESHGL
jgi:integrase